MPLVTSSIGAARPRATTATLRARRAPLARAEHAAAGGRPISAGGGQSFHFKAAAIGKASHAPGTAAAHQRYIERAGAVEEDREGEIWTGNLGDTPEERREFWQRAEERERVNGRVQSRFVAEFPHELSPEARRRVLVAFTDEFADRGLPYHAVAHRPDKQGDERNVHAHIVYHDRPVERVGPYDWAFAARKDREVADRDFPRGMRAAWAAANNRELERGGHGKRLDPRSYEEMGVGKEPEQHRGVIVTARERRDEPSRIGTDNAERRERYQAIAADVRDYLRARAQEHARERIQEADRFARATTSREPAPERVQAPATGKLAQSLQRRIAANEAELSVVQNRLDTLYEQRRQHQQAVYAEQRRPHGRLKWAEGRLAVMRSELDDPALPRGPYDLRAPARKVFEAYVRRGALYEQAEREGFLFAWLYRRQARRAHRELLRLEGKLKSRHPWARHKVSDVEEYRTAVATYGLARKMQRVEVIAAEARREVNTIRVRHAEAWGRLEAQREAAGHDRKLRRELQAEIRRDRARYEGLTKWREDHERRGSDVVDRGRRGAAREAGRSGEATALGREHDPARAGGRDGQRAARIAERPSRGPGAGAEEARRSAAAASAGANSDEPRKPQARHRPERGGAPLRSGAGDLRDRLRRLAGRHSAGDAGEGGSDQSLEKLHPRRRPRERDAAPGLRHSAPDNLRGEAAMSEKGKGQGTPLPYDPAKADPSLLGVLHSASQKGILGGALESMRHRQAKEKFERDQMRLAERIEAQRAKQAPEPARDPVQRYEQVEKQMLAEFHARAGRPMTPAQQDAREAQLKELNALAPAIQKDPSLMQRAEKAGIVKSVHERVRQQRRVRENGIER
jgi:hypothetical protein